MYVGCDIFLQNLCNHEIFGFQSRVKQKKMLKDLCVGQRVIQILIITSRSESCSESESAYNSPPASEDASVLLCCHHAPFTGLWKKHKIMLLLFWVVLPYLKSNKKFASHFKTLNSYQSREVLNLSVKLKTMKNDCFLFRHAVNLRSWQL